MPPATTTSASPSAMACAAEITALSPEPHTLLSVQARGRRAGRPAADRRLTRGRLADARLQHVAHHDLVHLIRRDAGPLQRGADRDGAEARSRHRREGAEERSDGRARRSHDDHFASGHGQPLCRVSGTTQGPPGSAPKIGRARRGRQTKRVHETACAGGRTHLASALVSASARFPALAVHGGAGDLGTDDPASSGEAGAPRLEGVRRACAAGWAVLAAGGSALDAVLASVVALEDDPTFNAGTGATLTSAGDVELDAAIMDGATLRCGAVAAVRDVRNPVVLARRGHGAVAPRAPRRRGASAFAREVGIPAVDNARARHAGAARALGEGRPRRRRAPSGTAPSGPSRATSAVTSPPRPRPAVRR